MFGLATPWQLSRAGIVGMNRRNVQLIAENNPRHLYPLVDDKLRTKQLLETHGLAAPQLIGVVKQTGQIKELPGFLEPHRQFVIKPARGSGGKGILVVSGREGDSYVKPSGSTIGFEAVARHINNTLSGLFSLGGKPDVAMIESMVDFDRVFDGFTFEGVPDIRVIVYKGFPTMAMTRLSTSASDGKANLHQGAVGVGLDIATGHALRAVMNGVPVETHPDTGATLADIQVPHWPDLVRLSARCQVASGLGYLGTDIVLDRNQGPQVLELNARPGLAIQVANGAGMAGRIDRIEALLASGEAPEQPEDRADWAMEAFA
ncbi:alpha-L-glutamate ligase-like protein [Aliiruegeria haliotis]|uniref:Alpha-L-glutamate ligase-like protein n=1 Tax=Aliiruegeria haliotis TaxID=1280846 RepID=A0A2T0RT38_9RHOB|nr:alpha-L-glutamate ligase-like protein [Aliiruegeria haliotis]PRY24253.1 alpha-L-glutamate ligase-like protein [Aliiruegeria haliotis]